LGVTNIREVQWLVIITSTAGAMPLEAVEPCWSGPEAQNKYNDRNDQGFEEVTSI